MIGSRLASGLRLKDAGLTFTWAAGLCWLVVATLGGALTLGLLLLIIGIPMAIGIAVPAFIIPTAILSGMWGYRSWWAAAAGAVYGLGLAVLLVTNWNVAIGLVCAVPGVLSIGAIPELRSGRKPIPGSF